MNPGYWEIALVFIGLIVWLLNPIKIAKKRNIALPALSIVRILTWVGLAFVVIGIFEPLLFLLAVIVFIVALGIAFGWHSENPKDEK